MAYKHINSNESSEAKLSTLAMRRKGEAISQATGIDVTDVITVLEEDIKRFLSHWLLDQFEPTIRGGSLRTGVDADHPFEKAPMLEDIEHYLKGASLRGLRSLRAQDNLELIEFVVDSNVSLSSTLRANDLITRLVAELGSDDAARTFLESPSEDLDGKTPLSFVKKHGLDALEKLVVWEETAAYA